jgi:predicted RNase H-like HicB family nuclease
MHGYIAIIHKDPDSDFGVSFPDFPGCITAGATLDEARAFAEEALALHVEGMIEDGEAIPEPSTFETVMAAPANRDGVAILIQAAPRTTRIGVS